MKATGYNSWTSWIALAACSVIGFLVLIPMRLAGLFFVVIIDQYGADREYATIPIVMFGVLRSLTGPFIGYLGEVIGLRAITLTGCVFTALGIGSCYFAEDITGIIICLGLIYGIGLAFGNTLLQSILRQHFNKNINFVNGIYLTGSCLGAVVMSPVIQSLIYHYGVSGMFLILSGILLHGVPACLFLKDPKNEHQKLYTASKGDLSDKYFHKEKQENNHQLTSAFVVDEQNLKISRSKKEIYTVDKLLDENKIPSGTSKKDVIKNKSAYINKAFDEKCEEPCSEFQPSDTVKMNSVYFSCLNVERKHTHFDNPPEVKLVSFSAMNRVEIEESMVTPNKSARNQVETKQKKPEVFESCSLESTPLTIKKKKITYQYFRLFVDPTFHLTMFVQSMYGFITTLNWTIILDFARDKGISIDNSVFFVMFLPVSEMFGNLSLNWITDHGFMTRTNFCMACYFILGIDAGYMIWCGTFVPMMAGVIIFGFVSGALVTTFPGMIFEFFTDDQQNMALASRFTLYAFLCITKSPLVGYFRSHLGSYVWIYYIIIACCLSCGVLVKLTPVLASCRKRNSAENKKI